MNQPTSKGERIFNNVKKADTEIDMTVVDEALARLAEDEKTVAHPLVEDERDGSEFDLDEILKRMF